jgi:phage tail sheath protein FI
MATSYLSPGVYIQEVDGGTQPIEGVSTSTTGFVGMTVRGPVSGPPTLVTSFPDFTRKFGGFIPDSATFHDYRYLPYAVKGFFDNEGALAYIERVLGQNAAPASDTGKMTGGLITALAANAASGNTSIKLLTTRGITAGAVSVTVGGAASNTVPFAVGIMPWIGTLSVPGGVSGAPVTITGVNFGAAQDSSTVTFNGTVATVTTWGETEIVVAVPATAASGNVVVTVVESSGNSVASNGLQFAVNTPVITGFSVPAGPAASSLTITGVNFGVQTSTSAVSINGTAATVVTWDPSGTSISVTVPADATTGSVVVTIPGATASSPNITAASSADFIVTSAPVIAGLSIPAGTAPSSVTITGANFGAAGTVTFNGTPATGVTWGTTSIEAPIPAGASTGNIVVTVGANTSNAMPFVVGNVPVITSLGSPAGAVGSDLVINGVNFGSNSGNWITIGGVPATTVVAWNSTQITVQIPAGASPTTHLTFQQVVNGITTQEGPIAVASYQNNGNVTLAVPLVNGYQAQYTTVFTDEPNPGTQCQLQAQDPGAWGGTISVQINQSSQASSQVVSIPNVTVLNTVQLTSAASFYAGALVEFNRGTSKVFKKIQSIAGSSIVVTNPFNTVNDLNPDPGFSSTTVRSCEFDVIASWNNVNEQWRYLSMDNTIPSYYATVINNGSSILSVPSSATGDSVTDNPFILPSAPNGQTLPLTGGNDGTAAPAVSGYIGVDYGPGQRTGIQALADHDDIAIVAVPGITDQDVINALITHCETLKYRFAIIDPAPHGGSGDVAATLDDIQAQRSLYDTEYAAIYYPRVTVLDPLTGTDIVVPPSGHMAGIYARVDETRGVYKAPANELIGGIDSIQVKLNKGDQDVLNPFPTNINALRDFTAQDRGLRVYGARCITSDPEWKYINIRRLFIFIEHSLDIGTQWTVFEPNDQALWARLSQSVSAFLTTLWQQGALMGTKASDAFFVRCDQTTMTQDDIQNGRLVMLVGIAPVFPAEFVIIQIGQWQGGSSVQEL